MQIWTDRIPCGVNYVSKSQPKTKQLKHQQAQDAVVKDKRFQTFKEWDNKIIFYLTFKKGFQTFWGWEVGDAFF